MQIDIRYPDIAPALCAELRDAIRRPEVHVPLQEYLRVANYTGIAFVAARGMQGLNVIDGGDELIFSMGDDTIYSVERPLGAYVANIIPRYCRHMMDSQPPVP